MEISILNKVYESCSKNINIVITDDFDLSVDIIIQLEKSYWVYIDDFVRFFSDIPNITFDIYLYNIFQLYNLDINYIKIYLNNYQKYKKNVYICGSILFDESNKYVIVVQNNDGIWGLPKGKIEKNETYVDCAIRETYEEIGLNIKNIINHNNYVGFSDRFIFYIIKNINKNIKFKPMVQGEIRGIKWISVNELIVNKDINGTAKKALSLYLKYEKNNKY
jgi:mRNA-decapping enzyme subunit 2